MREDSYLVGAQAVGTPPHLRGLRFGNVRRDRTHDALRQLLLDSKDVLQHAVIALCPDVIARQRVDELAGYANPLGCLADAPLQHVADAEVPTDLPDVRRLAL